MATGSKAKDIFSRTTERPDIGTEIAPRDKGGRPAQPEPYDKLSVCLFSRQTTWLDRVALEYRTRTGQHVSRTELIRALVDIAAEEIRPDVPDAEFEQRVRSLLEEGKLE